MLLMFVNHIHRTVCGLFLMMASVVVFAQAESAPQKADTPDEMGELVTEQLLSPVRKYNDGEVDTEAYFAEFEQTLEPVVHFDHIAPVATGPPGEDATEAQIADFARGMRAGPGRTCS